MLAHSRSYDPCDSRWSKSGYALIKRQLHDPARRLSYRVPSKEARYAAAARAASDGRPCRFGLACRGAACLGLLQLSLQLMRMLEVSSHRMVLRQLAGCTADVLGFRRACPCTLRVCQGGHSYLLKQQISLTLSCAHAPPAGYAPGMPAAPWHVPGAAEGGPRARARGHRRDLPRLVESAERPTLEHGARPSVTSLALLLATAAAARSPQTLTLVRCTQSAACLQ